MAILILLVVLVSASSAGHDYKGSDPGMGQRVVSDRAPAPCRLPDYYGTVTEYEWQSSHVANHCFDVSRRLNPSTDIIGSSCIVGRAKALRGDPWLMTTNRAGTSPAGRQIRARS